MRKSIDQLTTELVNCVFPPSRYSEGNWALEPQQQSKVGKAISRLRNAYYTRKFRGLRYMCSSEEGNNDIRAYQRYGYLRPNSATFVRHSAVRDAVKNAQDKSRLRELSASVSRPVITRIPHISE